MTDILFVQPWDRPWTDGDFVKSRKKMYMSRAQFEVGFQIPKKFSVKFLDLNLSLKQGESVEDAVSKRIASHNPKIAFISMPAFVLGGQVEKIIKAAKQQQGNTKIVLGGSALSLIRNAPLKWWPEVDFCYDGYGQEIPELIEKCLTESLHQHSYKPEKKIVDRYDPNDFYTAKNRLDFSTYLTTCRKADIEPMGIVEMTRGCKFNCSFCALNRRHLGFNSRSPKTAIDEIYFLAKNGVNYIHIIDPTFGLDKANTKILLNELKRFHLAFPEVKFEVLTRSEMITPDFGESLRNAGIVRCGIGMETMGKEELKSVNKGVDPGKTLKAIEILSNNDIQTKLFHILFPGKFSEETINFLLKLSQANKEFVLQTSFLRKLANQNSNPNFIDHDQTVFSKNSDTLEQIMEWMVVNLAFPSMDVGMEGDYSLQEKLKYLIKKGKSLKKLFEVKSSGKEIWLNISGKSYVYIHRDGHPVSSCLFTT